MCVSALQVQGYGSEDPHASIPEGIDNEDDLV